MLPVGVDPLNGLKPKRIIASGASQYAAIWPSTTTRSTPWRACLTGTCCWSAAACSRTALGVPVFKVYSETDIGSSGRFSRSSRIPTFSAPGRWPAPPTPIAPSSTTSRTTRTGMGLRSCRPAFAPSPREATIHFFYVSNAATDLLVNWVEVRDPATDGSRAYHRVRGSANVDPGAQQPSGIAIGGIRLADAEVPDSAQHGDQRWALVLPPVRDPRRDDLLVVGGGSERRRDALGADLARVAGGDDRAADHHRNLETRAREARRAADPGSAGTPTSGRRGRRCLRPLRAAAFAMSLGRLKRPR